MQIWLIPCFFMSRPALCHCTFEPLHKVETRFAVSVSLSRSSDFHGMINVCVEVYMSRYTATIVDRPSLTALLLARCSSGNPVLLDDKSLACGTNERLGCGSSNTLPKQLCS